MESIYSYVVMYTYVSTNKPIWIYIAGAQQ